MAKVPEFQIKNNFVLSGSDWVPQTNVFGARAESPADNEIEKFQAMMNYVYDSGSQTWVPMEEY